MEDVIVTRSMKRKSENSNNKKNKKKKRDDDDNIENIDDILDILLLIKKIKKKQNVDTLSNDDSEYEEDESEADESEDIELTDDESESSTESEEDDDSIIDKESEKDIKLYQYKMLEKKLFDNNTNILPFKHKILDSGMNKTIKRIIIEHINNFDQMSKYSSDYHKLKTWLDGLEKIPFQKYINHPVSLKSPLNQITNFLSKLQSDLNNCIYGQEDAKDSILQIITQTITNPKSIGSIIALKGPPGVGKTSLIKNGLSKALNIPFSFISLSGVNDVSYFDGFSYTYEGSRYGKLADILMKSECMNPIIFFDELDKISLTDKGQEISNLLIHLTDFTQNNSFEDKYFSGIPLDMSRVIFVFSLNNEYAVNPILRDRLQIVNLKGFKPDDKIKICKEYLIPEIKKNIGIEDNIIMSNECIEYIMNNYCEKEEGVRNLKRGVETLFRRINVLKYSNGLNLKYEIKNMSFPYTLNNKDIDELLKDKKITNNVSQHMMYL